MDSPLSPLFNSLVDALVSDLKDPDKRKDAYGPAVAILKNMDFGIVVKPGTKAASLPSNLPFPKTGTN